MGARAGYFASACAVMGLGLFIRNYAGTMPEIVARHAGDLLWACMVYCSLAGLLRERCRFKTAVISLLFCYGIEISQLYQAQWVNALRNTTLGGLVLGKTFQAPDLIRYSAGIAVACGLDALAFHYLPGAKNRNKR